MTIVTTWFEEFHKLTLFILLFKVGFFDSTGKVVHDIEIDVQANPETEVKQVEGFETPQFLYCNLGDHGYAKVKKKKMEQIFCDLMCLLFGHVLGSAFSK